MRPCVRPLVLGYAATLALFVYAQLEREPYDDSYFFKRIALNLLRHGTLAWNREDGAAYGLTSQSFGFIAVAITGLAGDHYVIVTRILLALCLLAAFALLLHVSWRADRGVSATYAFCSPVAVYTALSGMESAFAVLLLCGLLWMLYAEHRSLHWAAGPVLVLLVYVTRPDAALLAAPLLLVERFKSTRRWPVREVILLAAGLTVLVLAFWLCYGTALPLPFYAKSAAFSAYDAHFRQLSERAGTLRLALFLAVALPLAALGALKRDATNAALLGSSALHAAFHALSTIDVMGMHGRFYAPALPLLCLAASRGFMATWAGPARARIALALALAVSWCLAVGLAWTAGVLPGAADSVVDQVPMALYAAAALAALLVFAAFGRASRTFHEASAWCVLACAAGGALIAFPLGTRAWPNDNAYLGRHAQSVTSFRGMKTLRACLGEALHLYHSEVGVPGLYFQNGRVSDLAGIMSPRWLFRERSFDAICSAERPEAIFLPHRNYRSLNREIASSACIRGYVRVIERSSSPLYVRRDRFEEYARCAEQRGAPGE
ncbi:MAG TPA: hypothetical protein VK524_01265 [Polyangiaceae bacterium]|nr:hypothetical protein [Polyangiaceae bacterium]